MQVLLNVDVDDLVKAARLYERAFDLTVGRRLMADPFGHGFCFVQFAGQGCDEVAG